VQVQARGSRPNTAFIAKLGSSVLTEQGYVKVQPTLQLTSYRNIFAGGDVIDWKEQKQAAKAGSHAAIIVANVVAYLASRPLKPYKGSPEMIGITNGKVGPFHSYGDRS
jgi:thioredoxin reductase